MSPPAFSQSNWFRADSNTTSWTIRFLFLMNCITLLTVFHISQEEGMPTKDPVGTSQSKATLAGITAIVPSNDCLLSVRSVRGIKLFSQNDEDGALLQILRCLGHGSKEYFEFGSQTGVEVNTRVLRELYGWQGHLLDGSNEDPAIPLHKEFITPTNIVSLMEKYEVNKTLDVLSIDIDWDDLYIMREILLGGYRPRVLITEYNCNFGPELSVSVPPKPVGHEDKHPGWVGDCHFGASSTAFHGIAGAFGYTPVWSNTINLMYVRLDLALDLGFAIPSPESFPEPTGSIIHADCSGKKWKLIDINNLSSASDNSISHVDFGNLFKDVTLQTNNALPTKEAKRKRTFRIVE